MLLEQANSPAVCMALLCSALVGATGAATCSTEPAPVEVETFAFGEDDGFANAYLVHSGGEAILVDTTLTQASARILAEAIERSGDRLRSVLITSAHPHHLLGLEVLAERFPDAKVVATPTVAEAIAGRAVGYESIYGRREDRPSKIVEPSVLGSSRLEVGDSVLEVVERPGGTTGHVALVLVPSTGELLSSDLVWGDVHLDIGEKGARRWLDSLEGLSAWAEKHGVERVLPGHGRPGKIPLVQRTREYLRHFLEALEENTPSGVRRRMQEEFPDRRGSGFLERSVAAHFPG